MDHQEKAFFDTVRQALGHPAVPLLTQAGFPDTPSGRAREILERVAGRKRKDRLQLLERLGEEGRAINLEVLPVKNRTKAGESLRTLALKKHAEAGVEGGVAVWRHPIMDSLRLGGKLAADGLPFLRADLRNPAFKGLSEDERRSRLREGIRASFMGVTAADLCVAESATLVMRTRPGESRALSLVPPLHVAVIDLRQIVADFEELYTILRWDPRMRGEGLGHCLTFITGPSKTADIELQLVYGVHGPREVYLLVVTG